MGNYIQKRGDFFYYIEAYDKKEHRDNVLSNALGKKNKFKKQYIHGSRKSIYLTQDINNALFWKSEEAALKRIKLANQKDLKAFVKYLTREEFIEIIKDEGEIPFDYNKRKNIFLRRVEISYLEKLKEIRE